MDILLRLLLLVTLIECLTAGQSIGDNSVSSDYPSEEKSRFKKFLNLFGIGTTKQFHPNGHHVQEFNPYNYPCGIQTSTTTPAPVVLSPLLCPFPPMLPAHIKPSQGGGDYPQQHFPHPGGLDQLQPPPAGSHEYPSPPHSGGSDSALSRPPPGFYPPLPAGQPPPIFLPIQPGQNPQFPYPSQSVPPYPGQSIPSPIPIQNLPNPVQPGQGPGVPTIPGPFHPNESVPHNPEKPVMVDSLNPEDPIKVNPVHTNPLDPIKVKPSIVDPTKPIHVSPVDIKPFQPMLVDPATIQPGQPLFIDPLKPPPSLTTSSLQAPPSFSDPKAFSKYPAVYPFGPTNVLINPGFPEQPPPPPSTTPRPASPNSSTNPSFQEKPRPHSPFSTHVRPFNVLINPGFPVNPPPRDPNSSNTHLINPGLSLQPFPPQNFNVPPENIHLIPLVSIPILPDRPNIGGNPFIPIPHSFSSNNYTLPPPPTIGNASLPPPPSLYDNQTDGPPKNKPIASLSSDNNNYLPNVSPLPPPIFPINPSLVVPEHPRPPCGTPFLKPYVPHGFHLGSVNQFIGMSPVPNSRFNYPCPTLGLLQALDFHFMRDLIESSGLLMMFDHTKNYTLFVPSDAAFRRLPRWFRESLRNDKKLKKALLLNHLVKEDLPLSVLENEELVLSARPGGNRLRVNIYQLENAYRTITVDGSMVEKGDILTSNGRVHIVNKVLMPNLPRNAAQFLSEKLEFESFWNLVKQADLIPYFQDARPFTLFIPVNEAVQKLNDSAFLSDREKLRNFINYHMVNGTYYSNGLINNEFLLTNYEKEIKIQVTSDTFAKSISGINGRVRVLKSDITLTNGVAHVIDQCISEETPFYVYPQSDEFKNEYGVLRRNYRVTGEEKNIENAF